MPATSRLLSIESLLTAILTIAVVCALGCGKGQDGSNDATGAGGSGAPPPAGGGGTGGGGPPTIAIWDLANGVPQFIEASHIDLSRIQMVSKFRSGAGHDYSDGDISDGTEKCRSMKHYFVPFGYDSGTHVPSWTTIPIFSPVKGTILAADGAAGIGWGQSVAITPDGYPAFSVVIFHVALDGTHGVGTTVAAGEQIGTHASDATWDDLAIWVTVGQPCWTLPGGGWSCASPSQRLVSAFDAMKGGVFSLYQARGATARSDFIIDRATRDANPLQCVGQSFVTIDPLPDFVVLD